MRKKLAAVIATFICLSTALFGCNPSDGGSGNSTDKVDTTQTQLYVYVYSRGYGSEYLYKLKERYEALHANDVYETGKKGVQIRINVSDDNSATKYAENVKNQKDDVFFAEDSYYRALANAGALLDITDAVTKESEYDGKTVASKFNAHQDAYLKVNEKYYGVPHYQGEYGFVYDADLFEKKGYYFKDGYTVADGFVANKYDSAQYGEYYSDEMFVSAGDKTTKRTAGPDRIEGTADDGLPTTYDEFFFLLEHIAANNDIPVSWAGSYYDGYLNLLTHSLTTDYEGFDDMSLNYTFNGTDSEMIKLDADGKIVKNAAGVAETESVTVSESNASEVRRQAGLYKALQFMNNLINTDRYHVGDNYAFASFEHTANQEKFLWSSLQSGASVAMIADGIWWQREATQVFKDIVSAKGEAYSANNRNLGWLPLPKATVEKRDADNGKTTHNDIMNSFIFARAGIEDYKKDLARDFIKFACSDESLVEFTTETNTLKALTYTLSTEEQNKLTPFGRSLYKACLNEKSSTIYPYSSSSKYLNNVSRYNKEYYNVSVTQSVARLLRTTYQSGKTFNVSYADTAFESINKYFANAFN